MQKNDIKQYFKEHKRGILIGVGVTVLAIVGCVVAYRYGGGKQLFQRMAASSETASSTRSASTNSTTFRVEDTTKAAETVKAAASATTGERLTATALGDKVWASGREINKRLVDAGLLERLPNGDYYATEAGRKFCESAVRTQPWGYDAAVYVWDESVLNRIFTPQELAAIAERKLRVAEIVAATA